MTKRSFRNLMDDLTRRVEQEGKKNPSWLMGYLQGKGSTNLGLGKYIKHTPIHRYNGSYMSV